MFVICKHATPLTPVGGNNLSTQVHHTWNYHLPTQTAPSETFTSDLMASMMPPTFRCPRSCTHRQNQSPRIGLNSFRARDSFDSQFFHYIPVLDTLEISKALRLETFTKKTLQSPRSSVIHRSVHIARPTFSTTSLYSGCCHVTTSQTNTSRRWWLLWHLKKGRKYGTSLWLLCRNPI